jgi:replicative DNA helicase
MKGVVRLQNWGGDLIVKYLGEGSTVQTISQHIDSCRELLEFHPDLILVDFGELLEAPAKFRGDEYLRQSHIWRGLKSLATEREIAVYVATQTSRLGVGAERVSEIEMSDSIRKMHISDIVIGFNRNAIYSAKKREWTVIDEEWDEKTIRLFVIKHRGRKDKYDVRFACDLDRGQFYSVRLTSQITEGKVKPEEETNRGYRGQGRKRNRKST